MYMSGESFIVILFVGLVAGWLAGKIVRGTGFGLIGDILIGITGALVAALLFPKLGIQLGPGLVSKIIYSTIGAVILLLVVRLVRAVGCSTARGSKKEPSREGWPLDLAGDCVVLFDDLDNPAAARFDQDCAAVHDRVAIFADAIFLRHVVIGDAFFRQDGADAHILAILIGRAALFDDIAAKTRTFVDAQDAVHTADDTTDHAADDRADRTRCPFALAGALSDPSGDALRVCCDGQHQTGGEGSNSDQTADHDISDGGDEVVRQVMRGV